MIFQKKVRYVARTDGHLCNKRGPGYSLIEVKPRERGDDVSIRVQESAQMAAWISHIEITSHHMTPTRVASMFFDHYSLPAPD